MLLKISKKVYSYKNNKTWIIARSDHPDCQTAACEVYRTTSRTLPIYVKGNEQDQNNQTQLMIKRVILLRKLSEVRALNAGRTTILWFHVLDFELVQWLLFI